MERNVFGMETLTEVAKSWIRVSNFESSNEEHVIQTSSPTLFRIRAARGASMRDHSLSVQV